METEWRRSGGGVKSGAVGPMEKIGSPMTGVLEAGWLARMVVDWRRS